MGKSEDSSVWITKASKLIEEEQYEKFIACFDEVIKLDPEDSDAWNLKGHALKN